MIYKVLISWSDGADVCIEASSAEEAGRQALELVEQGKASYQLDQSNAESFAVADVQEVEQLDSVDKKDAGENADAWAELNEDADSLRVEMDKDGKLID